MLHPHADGPSPDYSTKHKSKFPQPGPPEPRATAEISIGMCQRQRHYTNGMHPFSPVRTLQESTGISNRGRGLGGVRLIVVRYCLQMEC